MLVLEKGDMKCAFLKIRVQNLVGKSKYLVVKVVGPVVFLSYAADDQNFQANCGKHNFFTRVRLMLELKQLY